MGKVLALTGHRPNKLGNDYDFKTPLSKAIIDRLQKVLDKEKPDSIISGMALGVDTMWAVLAIKNGIPFTAAVPCLNHSCKWPERSRKLYDRIIKDPLCTLVIVTETEYNNSVMQVRNEYMVDNADKLVAVWDGTSGGTGNCVRYAMNVGATIIRINPNDLK